MRYSRRIRKQPGTSTQSVQPAGTVTMWVTAVLALCLATASLMRGDAAWAEQVVEVWRGGTFAFPVSVSANDQDGSCWLADRDGNAVVHLDVDGTELWRGTSFSGPFSVSVFSSDGSCWVADRGNNQIVHVAEGGTELWRGGGFAGPMSVSVNTADGTCWVADTGQNQVVHLATDGSEIWRGGALNSPFAVSANATDGTCWVADRGNNAVVHLAADGTELWRGSNFNLPLSVAVNPADGTCWVADSDNNEIVHLDSDGTELWRGGGFDRSWSICPDSNDGSCWVADTDNYVVVLLAADGTERARLSGYNRPFSVSVDERDGSCWAADTLNGQVVRLSFQYTLSLDGSNGQVDVDGVAKTLPWSGDYINGTQVTLEAVPDATYEFSGWSGDVTGGENPKTVTVGSDMSVTANFSKIYYQLSLNGSGDGTVLVDGVERTLPWSGSFAAESVVSLEGVPGSCYEFGSWSGDLSTTDNPTTITMSSAKSVTASFSKIQYALSLSGSGSGSVIVDGVPRSLPWSGSFDCGDTVALEADPDACNQFTSWSGDLTGSANPESLTMDGAKSVTANFAPIMYALSLTGSGEGSVVVDGTPRSLPWSGSFVCGSAVSVEAVPASCYEFGGWLGDLSGGTNPETLSMNGPKSVTVVFDQIEYTLSLTGSGEGSILVDGTPRTLPWSGSLACGSSVELQAVPDSCYEFDSWSGDLTGASNPKSLTMNGPKSVTAVFAQTEYTLQIAGTGDGSVSVDGVVQSLPWSGDFLCGSTVTLEAVPDSCWQLESWSGDLSGSDNPAQLTIDGPKSVTANFGEVEYTLSLEGVGGGSVIVDGTPQSLPWSGPFACGSVVSLDAAPDSCYEFDSWSGDLSGSVTPRVLVMDGSKAVTATFAPIQYTLSIAGDGGSAIVDGVSRALPWSGGFDCGSTITLEAVPAENREFLSWSGDLAGSDNPAQIVMDGPKSVTATFGLVSYTLSVAAEGNGGVSVNGVPQTLPWSGSFVYGTEVLLEAVPDERWQFDAWSGDISGTAASVAVTVDGNKSVAAVFGRIITFEDVGEESWAMDAINACIDAGIISGYGDGLYRPDLKVSRAAMAVFIARGVAGGEDAVPQGPEEPTFSDVPTDHWAYNHIEYAAANAIVGGYGDDTYQPTWTVTRAQMAVFVARAIVDPLGDEGLAGYAPPSTARFLDVPPEYWSYRHIEYLAENGVVSGYDDGYYRPGLDVTREQMAVYIARAFGLIE